MSRSCLNGWCRLIRSVPALAVLIGTLWACQVPVFRYALERWHPDRYRVVVLHDQPLAEEQRAVLNPLSDSDNCFLPVDVQTIDVSRTDDPAIQKLWSTHRPDSGPLLTTLYPPATADLQGHVAYAAPLSADHVANIASSPARDEVSRRLRDGQSAVWIFLESGDDSKDRAALETLQSQLAEDPAWLTLPSAAELEIDPQVLTAARIRLRIEFSVVSVSRADPQEAFLVTSLLNSESDLKDFHEPMAFPVFGRGRVLYALVGAGIAADTIRTASAFVAGPCSCQVKNQNPGFDLLLNCDWDSAIGETFISQPIPPSGTGTRPTLVPIPPGRSER